MPAVNLPRSRHPWWANKWRVRRTRCSLTETGSWRTQSVRHSRRPRHGYRRSEAPAAADGKDTATDDNRKERSSHQNVQAAAPSTRGAGVSPLGPTITPSLRGASAKASRRPTGEARTCCTRKGAPRWSRCRLLHEPVMPDFFIDQPMRQERLLQQAWSGTGTCPAIRETAIAALAGSPSCSMNGSN